MSSIKRHSVTLEKRVEIVQKLEDGVSADDLAVHYGVSKRTIRRYKQESMSIRQLSENPLKVQSKRQRASLYGSMETRLYEWLLERRASGDVLTNAVMQEKARELQQEFGSSSNFTASQGWLSRFKSRYGIHLLNMHGERNIRNAWRKLLKIPNISEDSEESPHDCTADQTWDNGQLSEAEIRQWNLELAREESALREGTGSGEESESAAEEEEVDNMFYNLEKWAETQPEYIKIHTKVLIDYFNKT